MAAYFMMPRLHSLMAMPLACRYAVRELRSGINGFGIFIAALALGVGAIAAVGLLSESVVTELQNNARAMLGGDTELNLTSRPANDTELAYFSDNTAQISVVRDMRSMARNAQGSVMLVELKGVDYNYPLFGQIVLIPDQNLAATLAFRNGVPGAVAEPELFSRLKLELGDKIFVGNIEAELRAVIDVEPDRTAGIMALGPRLMVSADTLDDSGLVQAGTLMQTRYRMALNPTVNPAMWLDDLKATFPQAGWQAREYTSAQPTLQTFVDRLTTFLTLAGLTALLVGGVGVGNVVRSYLAEKTITIATLKSLGANGRLIFQIYFLQVAILTAIGVILGLGLGILTPLIVMPLIGEALPVAQEFSFYWLPLGRAAACGVLTSATFALWPLAQAREVPAAGLFRAIVSPVRRLPRPGYIILNAAAVLGLLGLAVFGTGNQWLGGWFVSTAVVGLIAFRLVASILISAILALPQIRSPSMRIALASLARPGAPTASMVMSLGLGLSVFVSIALLDANLTRQITEQLPDRTPAFFFIDIQPNQVAAFDSAVQKIPGFIELERLPTLRGRVVAINRAAANTNNNVSKNHWFVQSEIGFTYAGTMNDGTALTDGEWWGAEYEGPPLISLDSNVAKQMEIVVGDKVTFNILGRDIVTQVANLRQIDWQSMEMNFSVIFSPGTLEKAPQTYVASAIVDPGAEDAVFDAVTRQFKNISVVRVRDVIERATGLLDKISMAVRSISAVTVGSGVLVLAGAIAAGRRARVYDSVILKILGARRFDVLKVHVLEFAVLGFITGLISAATGTLAAWIVVRFGMENNWLFDLPAVLASAGGGMMLMIILGLAGTWHILGQKPSMVLRTT